MSVPITAGNPLIIGISSNDLLARQTTETSLKAIMFWANIDHIVGVSENYKKDESVLVVRIQRNKDPKWSDGANKKDVHKALVRVFPELDLKMSENGGTPILSENSSAQGTDWLGWTLIGSGVAAAGVGVVLWAGTLEKQRELECGYGNRDDCEGVTIRDPNSSEFIADQEAVDTRVLGSYILYGVGGALAAYGLYRVITYEPEDEVSFSPVLSPEGVGVQIHTRF